MREKEEQFLVDILVESCNTLSPGWYTRKEVREHLSATLTRILLEPSLETALLGKVYARYKGRRTNTERLLYIERIEV